MKRFPFILLAACAVAVAACGPKQQAAETQATGATGTTRATDTAETPPPPPGHITVNVSCRDTGNGVGVLVRPWRARPDDSGQLTWNLVPANDSMPTTMEPVTPDHWPLQQQAYSWSRNSMTAQLAPEPAEGTYRYRLTIICLPADTIVIDPEIIIT